MATPEELQSQYGTVAAQPSTTTAPPVVNPNVATPPVTDVFSPTNVAQTMTNPATPYDYSDPLKLRDRINTELGLGQTQTDYQKAINQLRSFDTGTTTQQFNIEQELNPLGVIRGEQATAAGQRSLYRQGYADTAQALADRYNALQTEANNRFNILNQERSTLQGLMISNPGAKITYTDTVETANKKVADYQKKEAKKAEKKAEEAAKDAYKKQLKAALIDAGLSTKGAKGGSLSSKEMEKLLAKNNASLLAEARAKANRGTSTAGQRAGAIVSEAQNALLASKGEDGKVDPGVYAQYRSKYASETGDVTGFDQQFGGLLSSQEQGNLGVQTSTQQVKLTGAQKDDIATMDTLSEMSTNVQNTLKSAGNKFSGVGGLGAGTVSQFFRTHFGSGTDEQQAVRDNVANIQATIAKLRGGTSFTANEQALLERYTPTINETPASVLQKLKDLNNYIETKKRNTLNVASGDFSGSSSQKSEEDILRDAGYTDEQIELLKGM